MTKIHPNSTSIESSSSTTTTAVDNAKEETLTVWRKSLLFNCKGFTVYDSNGNLAFRVDNYSTRSKRQIVLMDASGAPLFTVRRKRLSLGENWLIYEGEEQVNPKFSVLKHVAIRQSKMLARMSTCDARSLHSCTIEGSYSQRRCTIFDEQRHVMAELQRKEAACGVALGGDVFRLAVKSRFDASLAMAIVISLDQMFGS